MANTSLLRYEVEPWVREELSRRFEQVFAPRVLPLAPGGRHEFDAVSGDGFIVASIKANSGLTSGGNYPSGKVATCLNEIYFLTLVPASRRMLILTNPEFHEIFRRSTAGQIASGIDIELIPLPPALQAKVDGVVSEASREMTGEALTAASAVQAEEAGERGEDLR